MKILVTGAAGFIGAELCYRLAQRGEEVVGIDSLNDYYDVRLKQSRLHRCGISLPEEGIETSQAIQSTRFPHYRFRRMKLEEQDELNALFEKEKFDKVVNLAAQAGVRYSITHPMSYIESNLLGFAHLLECCRHHAVQALVFASSSSVYGLNSKVPFSEEDVTDTPVSLYAATKKANELMAHSYSKLYGLPATGLRFFTVYGPYGRPDMAPMLFAKAISEGEPIRVFNNGEMQRDFTYIDDIVQGTLRVIDTPPEASKCPNGVPFRVYNIGCSHPVKLMDFIAELEAALGKQATKHYLPMQPGDVTQTYADTSRLEREMGYKPTVGLHEGIQRFIEWYRSEENPLR